MFTGLLTELIPCVLDQISLNVGLITEASHTLLHETNTHTGNIPNAVAVIGCHCHKFLPLYHILILRYDFLVSLTPYIPQIGVTVLEISASQRLSQNFPLNDRHWKRRISSGLWGSYTSPWRGHHYLCRSIQQEPLSITAWQSTVFPKGGHYQLDARGLHSRRSYTVFWLILPNSSLCLCLREVNNISSIYLLHLMQSRL